MSDDEPYDVGFAKPPQATRFKKGQSGNPAGRPKGGASTKKRIKRMLDAPTPVKIGEQIKTLSTFDLALEKLKEGARKGDKSAIARIMTLAREVDKDDEAKSTAGSSAQQNDEPLSVEDEEIVLNFLARRKALRDAF